MQEPEVWVGVIVVIVLIGGFAVLSTQDSLTAQVVADPCDCVPDAPVCGALGAYIEDYSSACAAGCAGARVVFADRCGNIPLI